MSPRSIALLLLIISCILPQTFSFPVLPVKDSSSSHSKSLRDTKDSSSTTPSLHDSLLLFSRALTSGNEPSLLHALQAHTNAISLAMDAHDFTTAIALAKVLPRGADVESLPSKARALLLSSDDFVWLAAHATVSTVRGIPTEIGAQPPHRVLLQLPGNDAKLTVHMGSLLWAATLPEAGNSVPLQGFLHRGELVVDRDAHECTPASASDADIGFMCSIGGGEKKHYPTEAAAATEVVKLRGRAM